MGQLIQVVETLCPDSEMTFLNFLIGIGMGVVHVLSQEAVGRCFDSNFGKAIGIGRTGYSVGLFVSAPLVQLLLSTYGWRGCMLLMGGISWHLALCGALVVTSKLHQEGGYEPVPDVESPPAKQTDVRFSCVSAFRSIFENLDMRLLCSIRYWAVACVVCNMYYVYDTWVIYFVSFAQTVGFSGEDASKFLTVGGIGSLIAKLAQGFIVDRKIMPCWGLLTLIFFISSVSLYVTPWFVSYWGMMATSCLILVSDGFLACLSDVFTKQVLGADLLAGAFGWIGVAGGGQQR